MLNIWDPSRLLTAQARIADRLCGEEKLDLQPMVRKRDRRREAVGDADSGYVGETTICRIATVIGEVVETGVT